MKRPGQDFRNHISTADAAGRRMWIFPRKPSGKFTQWRTWLSYVLLVVMFVGPFIRINGNPLLMINIVERKFTILGQIFWPQDFYLFALAMLIFLTMVVIFTAVFGRVWCGWLCPQTVLMEMLFRRIEYFIEGDAHEQKALDRAPWTAQKLLKKGGKQLVFLALSFLIGNTLLAYIIGSDQLIEIITDDPRNHLTGLTFMILFTLVFYSIFARFREQACTFICPYGRVQSTLLDEHSIVVAYDYKRGESRGKWNRKETHEKRRAGGGGDCIDCALCVDVCPTGIDIRNGTQMECVHCTACMDACDSVMNRLNLPKGLVRYASLNGIEKGETLKLTPRIAIYSVVLMGLGLLLAVLLGSRADVETSLFRVPGTLYTQMPNGNLSNMYLLKLMNKTTTDIPVELRLESHEGSIQVIGNDLVAGAQKLAETSVLVELDPQNLEGRKTLLEVGVYAGGELLETVETVFVGPHNLRSTSP